MNQLSVIGLGAADFEQMQMGVYKKIKAAKNLYVRTEDHPVLQDLKKEGLTFQSFDEVYIKHGAFGPVYEEIAERLIKAVEKEDIMYAVPGIH